MGLVLFVLEAMGDAVVLPTVPQDTGDYGGG